MMETNLAEILGCPIPTIQIMDVGAAALTQDRYHPLLTFGHANVTGFEPNPAEYAKLQNRKGPYRYLPVFLGNGAPARFHIARYPGCSSLLRPNPSVIDMFATIGCADPGGNFHVVHTEMVETVRLDDLGCSIAVDYLKIDVQGYELEIMRNGTKKSQMQSSSKAKWNLFLYIKASRCLAMFSVFCVNKVLCCTN